MTYSNQALVNKMHEGGSQKVEKLHDVIYEHPLMQLSKSSVPVKSSLQLVVGRTKTSPEIKKIVPGPNLSLS